MKLRKLLFALLTLILSLTLALPVSAETTAPATEETVSVTTSPTETGETGTTETSGTEETEMFADDMEDQDSEEESFLDKVPMEVWVGLIGGAVGCIVAAIVLAVRNQKKPKTAVRREKTRTKADPVRPASPVTPTAPVAPPPSVMPVAPAQDAFRTTVPTPPQRPTVTASPVPPENPSAAIMYLHCVSGPLQGKRFPVGSSPVEIGRDASCQVALPANVNGVSRKHCRLFWHNGILCLMDMGSSYGTFLEGVKIAPNTPKPIAIGQVFTLGGITNGFVLKEN